jgi:hypothetical protein
VRDDHFVSSWCVGTMRRRSRSANRRCLSLASSSSRTGSSGRSGIGAPAPPADEAEIVRGVLGAGPVLAIGSPPSFFDQVHVWMTHRELAT